MSNARFTIREALPRDLPRIREILVGAELPAEGVDAAEILLVADVHGSVEGCAGLEVVGTDALLRSVAVADAFRGASTGTALVDAALDRARAAGVERIHLLTTTARGFFERLGFAVLPRERAPEGIAETTEFRLLCPDTATLMVLVLEPEEPRRAESPT